MEVKKLPYFSSRLAGEGAGADAGTVENDSEVKGAGAGEDAVEVEGVDAVEAKAEDTGTGTVAGTGRGRCRSRERWRGRGCGHTAFSQNPYLSRKTSAMFLAKAMDIGERDHDDVGLLIADPDKPTTARLALGIGRLRAINPDHRQWEPVGPFERHLLPPRHHNGFARAILAVPAPTWGRMGGRIIGLQFVSPFAGAPRLPVGGGAGR
jgi:hypothetical protein